MSIEVEYRKPVNSYANNNYCAHQPTLNSQDYIFVFHNCRFNLYLKLFIVMGVNWVMEVISWAAGGPKYLWYVTDLGNTLQGVLIFIIFVWKQKVRRLLARRLCPKLASSPGSHFDSSIKSRPTPSYTSSCNYTNRTSLSSHDQFHMKSTATVHNSDVPWSICQLRHSMPLKALILSLVLSGKLET